MSVPDGFNSRDAVAANPSVTNHRATQHGSPVNFLTEWIFLDNREGGNGDLRVSVVILITSSDPGSQIEGQKPMSLPCRVHVAWSFWQRLRAIEIA